ncbi:MAG: hypothetical protein IT236_02905 [Bacteroidia bacterium]|nr:hypothetical protein [Bacteroidia bacterium]
MDAETVNDYHQQLTAPNVLLVYGGKIGKGIASDVLSIITNKLEMETNTALKKRVLHVVVECVQNIERHCIEPKTDARNNASIVILKTDSDYVVSFCNRIDNSNVTGLKDKIEKVNSFNKEELVDFYKFCLRNNTMSEKGGAGLGLIEISRKSGNKIDYIFEEVDRDNSNFSLTVKIS